MHRVAGIVAVEDNLSTPEAATTRHLDETTDVVVRDTLEQPPLHERILADGSPGRQPWARPADWCRRHANESDSAEANQIHEFNQRTGV
jgi:hypothetical protein